MCPPVGVQKGHLKLGGRVRAEHAGGTQGRVRAYPPGHRGAFHLEPSAALFALGQDGQHGPRRGRTEDRRRLRWLDPDVETQWRSLSAAAIASMSSR